MGKTKIRKATTKRSLLRALRANSIKFRKVETIKRSTKDKVGKYRIYLK